MKWWSLTLLLADVFFLKNSKKKKKKKKSLTIVCGSPKSFKLNLWNKKDLRTVVPLTIWSICRQKNLLPSQFLGLDHGFLFVWLVGFLLVF